MSSWHRRTVAAVLGLGMAAIGAAVPAAADETGGDNTATTPVALADTPAFVHGPVAVLASAGATIARGVTITGGATIVRSAATSDHPVLVVDRDAHLADVAADTVTLGRGSTVGGLATNTTTPGGAVTGGTTALAVPVDVPYPAPAGQVPGDQDVTVPRGTSLDLVPGAYGDVSAARNTTVHLPVASTSWRP